MKRDLFVIFLCFAAGLTGANTQPILIGGALGKLLFPETSPSANISASGGALTIASGGTGQNINLTPGASVKIDSGATPANAQQVLRANGLGALSLLSFAPDNESIGLDVDWIGNSFIARNPSVAWLYKESAQVRLQGSTGNTVGGSVASRVNRVALDLATGNVGFGGNTSPNYAVDATGDVNASGVFRKGGTAGVSGSISVSTTSGTGISSITPSTGTAIATVSCTPGSIQYKDWSGTNQTASFCTGVTFTTGSFVVSVSTGASSFLTSAAASSNTFSGGIRTN